MQISFNALSRPVLFGMLLLAPVGCAGGRLFHWKKNDMPKADARNPAVKIVSIWEPANGQGIDGLPTRGFAGRILFFNRGDNAPVQVDGAVRVYVFEDRGSPEQQAKPIHQFDFSSDVWSMHRQKSMLGVSYNVFIPYTSKQPWQTSCGLRVRLTPKNGPTIFSEMVHVMLPGPTDRPVGDPAPPRGYPADSRLTVTSPDISGLPLGAVVRRQRITHGKATASTAPPPSGPLPDLKAAHRDSPQIDAVGPEPSSGRIRLTSAANETGPLELPAAESDVPQPTKSIEQLLDELRQQTGQTRRQPMNEPKRIPESAPAPDAPRRFRLTPTGAIGRQDPFDWDASEIDRNPPSRPTYPAARHPLDDSPRRPHPLAGL